MGKALAVTSLKLFLILVVSIACGQGVDPEEAAALQADIKTVMEQIRRAEAEDARYSGGLVKSLIGARLAILRQTQAMLEQRAAAWTHGISLEFTVNGSAFSPPGDAEELMASAERDLAEIRSKIERQEAEVAKYSGGLVLAMATSTLATMRQTESMLEQKQLALKYALPQYIGFASAEAGRDGTPATDSSNSMAPGPLVEPPKDFQIVSIDAKVTERNNSWWKYAWRLTIKNTGPLRRQFAATIEFQDKDGFIVDDDTAYDIVVPANAEETFTGYALVSGEVAASVRNVSAKIRLRR